MWAGVRTRATPALQGSTQLFQQWQWKPWPSIFDAKSDISITSLRFEHLEALHHAEAYTMLLDLARTEAPISEATMRKLHALVMRDLVDTPGQYRTSAVFISGSEYRPPHRKSDACRWSGTAR